MFASSTSANSQQLLRRAALLLPVGMTAAAVDRLVAHRALSVSATTAAEELLLATNRLHCAAAVPGGSLRTTSCFARTHRVLQPAPSIFGSTRAFTTSSTTATAGGGGGGGFVAWYEGHLEARPVLTKMCTGSLLWGLGDAVAQVVPRYLAPSQSDDDNANATAAKPYDWPRTGRAAFFGFALHAPLSHLHFNFLEWMTVRAGFAGLAVPLFKTFMEQFVYWSWFSNSLYHGAMGLLQGKTLQQCYDRIADVLWETQIAQWKFWHRLDGAPVHVVPTPGRRSEAGQRGTARGGQARVKGEFIYFLSVFG
jgi:protein Mpv17